MLLVSGATKTMRAIGQHPNLGVLIRPGAPAPVDGRPWAMDNGAFSGFKEEPFLNMLWRNVLVPGCMWVACPDVVGDARATAALYAEWAPRIRNIGYPVAWVAQDGATPDDIPLDCVCVFIGGSTAWKLGEQARQIVSSAKARGLMAHMGRVNSVRRMRIAHEWGCDSVDGTKYSMFANTYLRGGLNTCDRLQRQGRLAI
jgi:hypothetical protein